MDWRPTRRSEPYHFTRPLTAVALVLALLSGAAFLEGVTLSGLCKMECCVGRSPHASGSCAHGSCHVDLQAREASPAKQQEEQQEEHHGAQAQPTRRHDGSHAHDAPSPPTEHASLNNHPHDAPDDSSLQEHSPLHASQPATASVVKNALTRPCPPDCDAGTFSYPSPRRPRDAATTSYPNRSCPASGPLPQRTSYDVAKALEDLCRHSSPRGPPPSFS